LVGALIFVSGKEHHARNDVQRVHLLLLRLQYG